MSRDLVGIDLGELGCLGIAQSQIPSTKSQGFRCQVSGVNVEDSGVRCQVSGKRYIEAEACWSEAEIPSEAKRQRGTLKPPSVLNTET